MTDIFVDFSATYHGDGTDAAQATDTGLTGAYNTLSGVAIAAGDSVWIRRNASYEDVDYVITTLSGSQVHGWPESGHKAYAIRPTSGTSAGWDSDASGGAMLNYTTTNAYTRVATSNGDVIFSNLTMTGYPQYRSFALQGGAYNVIVEDVTIDDDIGTTSTGTVDIGGERHILNNFTVRGSVDSTTSIALIDWSANRCVADTMTVEFGEINDANDGVGFSLSGDENTFIDLSMTIQNFGAGEYSLQISGDGNVINGFDYADYNTVEAPIEIPGNRNVIKEMTSSQNQGQIYVTGTGNVIEASGLHFSSGDAYPLDILGSKNLVRIDGISSTSDASAGVVVGGTENVVVLKDYSTWNTSDADVTGPGSVLYSLNHGGTSGYWKAFFMGAYMESSLPARTGGATGSLRGQMTSSDAEATGFILGVRDMAEVLWSSLPSGESTITIYGAHKLFTDTPTSKNFWIETDYTDASGVLQAPNSRTFGEALESDASTWSSDTGLTAFKISLTITLTSAQVVPIRFRALYPFDPTGYFYIDPKPVVS